MVFADCFSNWYTPFTCLDKEVSLSDFLDVNKFLINMDGIILIIELAIHIHSAGISWSGISKLNKGPFHSLPFVLGCKKGTQ